MPDAESEYLCTMAAATLTYVFYNELKGEEKLTLAALKFLRVLHAVDNGKYSPHLGCQAETQTRI